MANSSISLNNTTTKDDLYYMPEETDSTVPWSTATSDNATVEDLIAVLSPTAEVGHSNGTFTGNTTISTTTTTITLLDILSWNPTGSGFNFSHDLPFVNGTPYEDLLTSNVSSSVSYGSVSNSTTVASTEPVTYWNGSMYPSGHTMTHIVITAVFVTLLMSMVVVGNMLVIVAIVTEKALKTIQNWFIASLAVADFFVGLIVMPFSLAQELMGYWIFGFWWCEIHLAVDVLLCTSSIMNLCLISLDRYWSITQAVDYLKKRTPGRAVIMITTVWILSFLVSVPPLLGWKKYSKPSNVTGCEVSDDLGYVIYSASGSFYIPSIIMVFVYVRIYFAARSRARRVVKKHRPPLDPTKDKSTTTTSFSNASPPDKNKNIPNTPNALRQLHSLDSPSDSRPQYLCPPGQIAVVSTIPTLSSKSDKVTIHSTEVSNGQAKDRNSIADQTTCEMIEPLLGEEEKAIQILSRSSASSPPPQIAHSHPCAAATLAAGQQQQQQHSHHLQRGVSGRNRGQGLFFNLGSMKSNGNSRTIFMKSSSSPSRLVSQAHALAQAQAQILLADEMECLSELDHSSDSDQPNRDGKNSTGFRRFQSLCHPPKKSSKMRRDEIDLGRVPKPRDPEREKRRLARKKERRATLILGLIMASFILCWLPFFTLYVIRGFCSTCHINELGFDFAFWLGYCNSALNPVIYTIFNKDFRKAFRKILFK